MLPFVTEDCLNITREYFPNNQPNIKIDLAPILNHKGKVHVVYYSYYADMGEKKIEEYIIWVLADTVNISALTIVDMYDPAATMERVDGNDEGRIATSNVDAQWWKALPRKVNRVLFDHHTLQNRFYFTGGNTRVWFLSAISLVTDFEGSVCFPDAGASKRYGGFFDQPKIVCAKKRTKNDGRVVVIQDGEPDGCDVLIVDDLVRSGGTLIECMNAVLEAGAKSVTIFVTHAEFPDDGFEKISSLDKLSLFYFTNTVVPVASRLDGIPKFKCLSVKPFVDETLEKIEAGL